VQIEVVEQEKQLLARWRELGGGRSMHDALTEPARPDTPMVAFEEDDVGWADPPVAQHESDSSTFSTSDDGDATGHFELPTTRQRADVSRDGEEVGLEVPLVSDRSLPSDSEGELYSSSSPELRKKPLEQLKRMPTAAGSGDADFSPDTSEGEDGLRHEKLPLVRPRKVAQKYATESESESELGGNSRMSQRKNSASGAGRFNNTTFCIYRNWVTGSSTSGRGIMMMRSTTTARCRMLLCR
jgi:hypothetical protein